MISGPNPNKSRAVKRDIFIAFGLIAIFFLISAIYASHHHKKTTVVSTVPAGWTEYIATKYGFKFDYPSTWGKAQVNETKGNKGSHYQIGFAANPKSKTAQTNSTISISMDSSDYVSTSCTPPNCKNPNFSLNAQDVKTNIRLGAKNFTIHDDSSYAIVTNVNSARLSSLAEIQIINLANIKVSAAVSTLSRSASGDCPQGKFAANTKQNCITESDYSTLNRVLKSIKSA